MRLVSLFWLAVVAAAMSSAPAAGQAGCDTEIRIATRPGDSARAVPNADGSVVAFTSQADALTGRRGNPWNGVFRLRRGGDRPVQLSPSDQHGDHPSISADGTKVAFVAGGTSARPRTQVHVHDAATGLTSVVSRASGVDGAPAEGESELPEISADGNRVAFVTTAALDPADDNGQIDAYLRDLRTSETIWVSRGGRAPAERATRARSARRSAPTAIAWPSSRARGTSAPARIMRGTFSSGTSRPGRPSW